ncbi:MULTISPECIES: UbiA family prenyltransferase [unclassified Streptomyces]|uniref:UbiA family prenyltransferase n=1 Tax=unclassified Streptomyces TaxID=2593676 RepID=UPI0021C5B725|nr:MULTISPECIES: UbiA family prenyltransferase [unclassified Streptomyces]MDX3684697.1 UbiA family prenyltransferase [Streptomyces sp. AK04-4c]
MDTTDRPHVPSPAARLSGAPAGLALSCHPGPVVAVTGLATALAVSSGPAHGRWVLVGAAVLAGQLSVGWCNDAFDAVRDAGAARPGKPVARGAVGRGTVWGAAFTALFLCAVLSFACGAAAGAAHMTGVVAAWAYNLRLKGTALSWLPYAIGFGSLPCLVALSLPGSPWPAWWAVAAGALLGVAAHLGDVLPDIEEDLRAGVRGLPQRLGPARVRRLLPAPLVAATAVLLLGPSEAPGGRTTAVLSGVALCAVAAATVCAGPRPVGAWRKAALAGTVVAASADVALLLARGTQIA